MANTKSAEKRMRTSERRRLRNRGVKSGLRKLEKTFLAAIAAAKKEEAQKGYRELSSALDKAAKGGVVPKPTASRKKSRLAAHLNGLK